MIAIILAGHIDLAVETIALQKLARERDMILVLEPKPPKTPDQIIREFAVLKPVLDFYEPEAVEENFPVATPATCARRMGLPKPFILIRPKDWG